MKYEFSVNLVIEVEASNENEAVERYDEVVRATEYASIIDESIYNISEV